MASTVVVNKVFPATVLIATEDKNDQLQSLGSGFLVSPNIIATNFHVIENSHGGYVKLVNKDEVYEIDGVVGYNIEYDLALIKIADNSGTPLTLKSPVVNIGQKIFAIGNPLGLEGTISDGMISGLRDFEDFSLLQISAPISPGNSGGPVVDENGEVVGVATYTFSEGQNLNFAVPVKYLKELFNNQTPLVSLASLVRTDSTPPEQTSIDFKGVSITKMIFSCWFKRTPCFIEFSFKNNLSQGIKRIRTSLIMYDIDGEMLDYDRSLYFESYCLPAKHSTRSREDFLEDAVDYLVKTGSWEEWEDAETLMKFSEFKIIDYEICD